MKRGGLSSEHIVTTAADIVDAHGLEALTLAAVAAAVGVRTPSLYNHIDGLAGLKRLLRIRAFEELGARLQRAAVGRSGPDAIRAIASAYRKFAHARPGLYAATITTTETDDPQVRKTGAEVLSTVTAVLEGMGLEDDETVHAARALRSSLHGFVALEHAGGFGIDVDLDASFERLVDWLVEALAS